MNDKLNILENQAIIGYIERLQPSAHSDVAEELMRSIEGLDGAYSYCPDPQAYAYYVLHVDSGSIFGFAFGMSRIAYKIPLESVPTALADGAEVFAELGDGWVLFSLFHPDVPVSSSRAKLKRWCQTAYNYATGG